MSRPVRRTWPLVGLTVAVLLGCSRGGPRVAPPSAPVPDRPDANGLTGDDRDTWYHMSQGSELYPYRFLKALSLVDEQKPFIDHLDRYGFLPDAVGPANPFGVPIGVTVAPTRDLSFAGVNMLGINCAACHTTALERNG